MEMNFSDYYVKESAKEYKFKLKFALPEMDDCVKDCLESALSKYDLKSISAFKETPIQESPLDFPNVKNCKVFIAEIVLGYPSTSDMLRRYISGKTGVSEQNIAVYNAYDPRETYTQEWLERMDPSFKENYEPKLGSEYEETVKPFYGKEANDAFLKELEDERKKRKKVVVTNDLIKDQVFDRSGVTGEEQAKPGGHSVLGGPGGPND